MLVSTRSIAHSGQSACIRNSIGELGMDSGQPLVTSNGMLSYSSDHHKAYYTYIGMYIQKYMHYYVTYGHWGEFMINNKMQLLLSEGLY